MGSRAKHERLESFVSRQNAGDWSRVIFRATGLLAEEVIKIVNYETSLMAQSCVTIKPITRLQKFHHSSKSKSKIFRPEESRARLVD